METHPKCDTGSRRRITAHANIRDRWANSKRLRSCHWSLFVIAIITVTSCSSSGVGFLGGIAPLGKVSAGVSSGERGYCDQSVTVQGTVVSSPGIPDELQKTLIMYRLQDDTGGILVYKENSRTPSPDFGESVKVTGIVRCKRVGPLRVPELVEMRRDKLQDVRSDKK